MAGPPPSTFPQDPSQYSAAPASSQTGSMAAENGATGESAGAGDSSSYVPRPKRIACVVCRRRKLRCDGKRPSCGTCSRLGHECSYDEVRKKSGPKRGYVKQLEARLAQVETLLKGQEPDPARQPSPPQPQESAFAGLMHDDSVLALPDISALGTELGMSMPPSSDALVTSQPSQTFYPAPSSIPSDPQWDMISLGLEEPLPPQEVVDDLDNIFFEKVYPTVPIIHRPRYFASLNLAPNMRPPICLRYIMWCHAAVIGDKYYFLHNHFYQRARKYAEIDEMKGFGETVTSVAHCQTWILMGGYEFRMIYFPRAWLSVGKAARIALMIGLNRLDGTGLDVKQSVPPPKDWTEREERRRVFWLAFCSDRYASVGTGWPMVIDEQDIRTNLPASEESFLKSKPQRTLSLADITSGEGVSTLSPFGSVVVLACLYGRNLLHIHRPHPQDNDHDLNGEFWKRHRSHDNILLHIALSLPDHLRLPGGMADGNVVFANMSIHTSTICLHQAAIFKAEKNKMPNQIITESKRRCLVAANQITSIMKMISHVEPATLNPFISFCLYISARVFVQYLKARPDDSTVHSSLQFLVSALNAMKAKNLLTESFLVQLDVDLEGTGIRASDKPLTSGLAQAMTHCADSVVCSPLYTINQSQSAGEGISGPSEDGPNPGTTHRPPRSGMTTSLPNRRRHPTTLTVEGAVSSADMAHMFGDLTHHAGRSPDTAGPGAAVDMEMDFSPDFRYHPPSDHPTPSTLNSSNTSYSVSGNQSPGKKQHASVPNPPSQAPATSMDKGSSVYISPLDGEPSQVPDMGSMAGRLYPTSTSSPLGHTEAAHAFSMPSVWDLPTSNRDMSHVDFENVNMESLNEAQWAQILSGTGTGPGNGWENWRPT